MASAYPGGLDSLATNKSDSTSMGSGDHSGHHNDLADAVNKIEAELGVNPSGSAATVVARLDGLAAGTAAPYNVDLGLVSTSPQTVDLAGKYDTVIRLSLGINMVLNLTNIPVLARVSIRATQDATGGRTLTIQQDGVTTTVDWDGGTAHSMTSTANAVDRIAGEKAATALELGTVGKAYA